MKMRNKFFPILFLQMSYALIYGSIDNFETSYSVTFESSCHLEEDRFRFMLRSTISQCVEECGAHSHCQALNFRSRINICELFSTKAGQQSGGDCIYIAKEDIAVIKSPCQGNCKYGKVCENTGHGTGKCSVKECVNTTVPVHGAILGNQREFGKKIRYRCDNGYKVTSNTDATIAECLDTGDWSATAECVQSTIGKGCTRDEDCIEAEGRCFERKCFCNPLYRYSTTLKDCVKVCESMSNEFEVFHGYAIAGYNIAPGITYDSLDDCTDACIEDKGCNSFDVQRTTGGQFKCWNGLVTREMLLDADPVKFGKRGSPWQLYSRKCYY